MTGVGWGGGGVGLFVGWGARRCASSRGGNSKGRKRKEEKPTREEGQGRGKVLLSRPAKEEERRFQQRRSESPEEKVGAYARTINLKRTRKGWRCRVRRSCTGSR